MNSYAPGKLTSPLGVWEPQPPLDVEFRKADVELRTGRSSAPRCTAQNAQS